LDETEDFSRAFSSAGRTFARSFRKYRRLSTQPSDRRRLKLLPAYIFSSSCFVRHGLDEFPLGKVPLLALLSVSVREHVRYVVTPCLPYSIDRTLARLSRFPEKVDVFAEGVYRRLFFLRGRPHFLHVSQQGPPSRARLTIEITGREARTQGAKEVAGRVLSRVLGASTDVRPFYRSFRTDPLLGPLIRRHLGLRVTGRLDLWETLLQIVLSQQIHLKLAHGMLAGLSERLGRRARLDGNVYYSFPSPSVLSAESVSSLRRFRLSRSKAETLKRLAAAFESGDLAEDKLGRLSDEEAIELLQSHKGVGRWTAEFALLRGLGRMDVFPGGDLGVVKHLAQEMLGYDGLALEKDMRRYAERWRPYRGLALIYAYAELALRAEAAKASRT
jgi:DNA-3-methyladenine glycosylase II